MPATPEDITRVLRPHWVKEVREESRRLGLSVREAAKAVFTGELDSRAAVAIGTSLSLLGIGPNAEQVDPEGRLKARLPVARRVFEGRQIFMPLKQ